ncbi:MAG: hypothetical protein EB170_01165 [Nitrosopumilaceae archaeon]|nr:hypothetical protein [Nitrososphaeria archaeon]NDB62481.1 hypothetical protein [Nitrosopumilaceae archaeon]NDB89303.1 hypothetical protein [Nitrososphaerota archaeon]NDB92305.1 hypothetical protein [Nitrososphaeria archaeon]NDF26901.1 hypothetical protein [Nitrosopumilaceae archaeon]
MKIIDMTNPDRIKRDPDEIMILVESGNFKEQGFVIQKISLRLFIEKQDAKLGSYSLITSLVETDQGEVEMIYDEGYRGENALGRAGNFLMANLGLSSIILRSIIALQSKN